MSIICPTILAYDPCEYKEQIDRVLPFAKRIQIDLKDGEFTDTNNISLDKIFLPHNILCDIHLMYKNPQDYIHHLIKLKPNLVIVHAESDCDIPLFATKLREANIKTGIAIIKTTTIDSVRYILPHVQHLLIFSGDLGHFGGSADISLTSKIDEAKRVNRHLEFGWDGGINIDNVAYLSCVGINVLDVGGALQNARHPAKVYDIMEQELKKI